MTNRAGTGRGRLLAALVASLTLGLAPFTPLPHALEKVLWLFRGQSFRPIDVFDLFFHGWPWVWLAVEAVLWVRRSRTSSG